MPGPIRKISLLTATLALSVALGGCVVIKSQTATQVGLIGDMQVLTTACASDVFSDNAGYSPADPDCQGAGHGGNSGIETGNGTYQLLLGYRIPDSATAPDSIATTSPSGSNTITFSADADYTAALQAGSPAPDGEKWVGFLSGAVNYTTAGEQRFSVAPRFGLRRGGDGAPFTSPFAYRAVVGSRVVDGSHSAARPVTCPDPVTTVDISDQSICIDDPDPTSLATDLQQPTRDLGILDASAPQTFRQGNVARVNFNARYSGSVASPSFQVSASTDLPGATANPSTPTIFPDPGANPIRVLFRVPITTEPGSYDVTLTAKAPDGETRTSTHEIVIEPTKVRCAGMSPLIAGTRGDDILVGTPGPDVIATYDGNDEVLGLGGNDIICAGRGDDKVRGGAGNDRIAGRDGRDMLIGGHGRDVMLGGGGKDTFRH
jgi:Ca2+-binding RTX toxin-like protein